MEGKPDDKMWTAIPSSSRKREIEPSLTDTPYLRLRFTFTLPWSD